jgi:hypothetical protein
MSDYSIPEFRLSVPIIRGKEGASGITTPQKKMGDSSNDFRALRRCQALSISNLAGGKA